LPTTFLRAPALAWTGTYQVVVPKPFNADGTMTSKAVVSEGGKVVWDGSKLVDPAPEGFVSATDGPEGVAFQLLNGEYDFSSAAPATTLEITASE
jgi:hypothetical protein